MRFLVGGYTTDGPGEATGIGVLIAGAAEDALAGGPLGFDGHAVMTGGSPSWLAAHPSLDVVYAALEGAGAVRAFRRTGEASLDPLGEPVEAGEVACHVAVAPDGGSLLASCYGDGRVVRLTLDAAGRPAAPAVAAAASDPYGPDEARPAQPPDLDLAAAARALREAAGEEYAHLVPGVDAAEPGGSGADSAPTVEGVASRVSRAHQAVFLPGGVVATTDLGFDLVRFWRVRGGELTPVQQVVLPFGSGPRHAVWHPSGHLYVLTELSHEVFVLAPDPSTGSGTGRDGWRVVGGTSLGAGVLPDDAAAHLCTSRDGGFLYAGVRGSNTVATLRIVGDGASVAPVALVEAGVDWPRHHVVERDTLLVAGQRSDEVASLTLDLRTGVPGRVRYRAAVPTPSCLLPVR